MIPQQPQQQQSQQQFCVVDNCLKQQQHFAKNHQNLQQQTATHLQQQHNYHQHQLQQHVLQQQQQQPPAPPPPHMWNPHLSAAACYSSQSHLHANANGINSSLNPTNNINLQNCRPYPSNRLYPHPTHNSHYLPSNGFPHALTANTQASERMSLTAPNYAKFPPLSVVNQQRINECAGIPLISTATAHLTPGQRQRVSRKQSHSPPGKNWSNMLHSNAAQNYAAVAHYATAHVQGAPLIFTKQQQQQKLEYWTPHNFASSTNQIQQHQQYVGKTVQYNSKPQDRTRTPLRYQNSAPASLSSSKSKENLEQQLKQAKDNSETSSSNNGDSSNSTETCLPRIIKPRKRRKKDRKPPSNLVNAVYLKMDNKNLHNKSSKPQVNALTSYKSSEDLLKCLQKFTQITNLNEHPQQPNNIHLNKNDPIFEPLTNNKTESTQYMSRCTAGNNINHGICFCNDCDPLRSIWDYPLRRSLSDSSTSDTSGTGSLSDTPTESVEAQYNWPKSKPEVVGVIGSQRNKDQQNSSNNHIDTQFINNNLLSGINFDSELLKHTHSTAFANLDSALTAAATANSTSMMLLPETAETLLTKSINEISKKLIETCSNESCDLPLSVCNSLLSYSTASSNSSSANSTCADFSNDSGIESAHINVGDDLVFNFDNLHITTTKLSLSPASLSSSVSSSSSSSLSSSSSSSSSTSSCGNLSLSSSPTVKFASNFLTTTTGTATAVPATVTGLTTPTITPLIPSNAVMDTTIKAAPTLDFMVDLNNNHLHVATPNAMIVTENTSKLMQQQQQQQQQSKQFNDLVQIHQPPQTKTMPTPPAQQYDRQFFNNCFDLMWQQQQQQQHDNQLEKKNISSNTLPTPTATTNTNTTITINNKNNNSNHIEQLTSTALTSNNVAMSSFLDSVGSLQAVFSTMS